MRYSLKLLLLYKGFLFEKVGQKVRLKTKIWAVFVNIFVKWNQPKIYSFQKSLPHLPLPPLNETMKRYLRSIRPLNDDESYEEIVKEVEKFQNGIGKKLQFYLTLKSWWSTNYVTDWWEKYVYLRGRSPLMINSNYYLTDYIGAQSNVSQTARAANCIYILLQIRRKIDHEEIEPIMVQKIVPLCSWQYKRLFNTTRIPGIETDELIHLEDSHHIAVLYKGSFYKVIIYNKGRLLNALEIQYQLDRIVNSDENSTHGEKYLASLTAWNRTKWAETRNKYFSKGTNKSSLEIIESAALFVSLIDDEWTSSDMEEEKWNENVRSAFHLNVCHGWFDKSLSFIISKNGRVTAT